MNSTKNTRIKNETKMNKLDSYYQNLLKDILENGTEKETRNGNTISVFGRQIRHKMSEGFPALTTKKLAFKTMTTELLWFLRGDTNIKYLVNNGCNIWNGDAYKKYKEAIAEVGLFDNMVSQEEFIERIKTDDDFAHVWGDLGPIYGVQWRKWPSSDLAGGVIDQIKHLIHQLKNNPDSRRLMVSAWNVDDLEYMVLPPCHYGFQVYTRELSLQERREWCNDNGVVLEHLEAGLENEEDDMRGCGVPTRAISLMFNMRSNDVPLGLPFNIASYGLLLEIFGKMVNMVPDELIANLGDAHIYKNQIDGVKEQLTREPYNLPKLDIHPGILDYELDKLEVGMFKLVNYKSHPSIKMPLSN